MYVNSLTASAFDLPDILSAKADPALIAAGERHFAAIAQAPRRAIAQQLVILTSGAGTGNAG
jgi:hypothetical protein